MYLLTLCDKNITECCWSVGRIGQGWFCPKRFCSYPVDRRGTIQGRWRGYVRPQLRRSQLQSRDDMSSRLLLLLGPLIVQWWIIDFITADVLNSIQSFLWAFFWSDSKDIPYRCACCLVIIWCQSDDRPIIWQRSSGQGALLLTNNCDSCSNM